MSRQLPRTSKSVLLLRFRDPSLLWRQHAISSYLTRQFNPVHDNASAWNSNRYWSWTSARLHYLKETFWESNLRRSSELIWIEITPDPLAFVLKMTAVLLYDYCFALERLHAWQMWQLVWWFWKGDSQDIMLLTLPIIHYRSWMSVIKGGPLWPLTCSWGEIHPGRVEPASLREKHSDVS